MRAPVAVIVTVTGTIKCGCSCVGCAIRTDAPQDSYSNNCVEKYVQSNHGQSLDGANTSHHHTITIVSALLCWK